MHLSAEGEKRGKQNEAYLSNNRGVMTMSMEQEACDIQHHELEGIWRSRGASSDFVAAIFGDDGPKNGYTLGQELRCSNRALGVTTTNGGRPRTRATDGEAPPTHERLSELLAIAALCLWCAIELHLHLLSQTTGQDEPVIEDIPAVDHGHSQYILELVEEVNGSFRAESFLAFVF